MAGRAFAEGAHSTGVSPHYPRPRRRRPLWPQSDRPPVTRRNRIMQSRLAQLQRVRAKRGISGRNRTTRLSHGRPTDPIWTGVVDPRQAGADSVSDRPQEAARSTWVCGSWRALDRLTVGAVSRASGVVPLGRRSDSWSSTPSEAACRENGEQTTDDARPPAGPKLGDQHGSFLFLSWASAIDRAGRFRASRRSWRS